MPALPRRLARHCTHGRVGSHVCDFVLPVDLLTRRHDVERPDCPELNRSGVFDSTRPLPDDRWRRWSRTRRNGAACHVCPQGSIVCQGRLFLGSTLSVMSMNKRLRALSPANALARFEASPPCANAAASRAISGNRVNTAASCRERSAPETIEHELSAATRERRIPDLRRGARGSSEARSSWSCPAWPA
jgi:hypothetical protein